MSGTQLQIDFRQIRPFDGDRRKGFEEFVCQLARRKPPTKANEFRRVEGSGGDGGIEAYWTDTQGSEHGFQAKYFLATKDIDWAQIDKSVKAALGQHPALATYSIALACDLTDRSGAQGRGKTGWEHWDSRKKVWEDWASSRAMRVSFSVWTKSDMVNDLASHADRRGLMLFWFNEHVFDELRLHDLFERVRADLGERFHPEDNVNISLTKAIGGMRRSPEFVQDIASWFQQVPSPVSLISSLAFLSVKPPEQNVTALKDVVGRLHAIGAAIKGYGLKPYPLSEWQKTIEDFWIAESTIRKFLDGISADKDRERSLIQAARRHLSVLSRYIDSEIPMLTQQDYEPLGVGGDRTRLVVIRGEPGSGKSHLFADAVSTALRDKAPAVLMLGQNFFGDIRKSFLRGLGVPDLDYEVALQALDVAGELAGQRTLILLDALNEAGELRIWPDELSGFASDVLKFDHLSLGVSLRPEYFKVIIPDAVGRRAKVLTHHGIETPEEQEQAAIQYFEKRGIARPTVPWLAPEFSNFLFLRTVCDAISISKNKEFPRGLRGSLDVLRYYLASVDMKLRKDFLVASIPEDALVKAISGVATDMAKRKKDFIDLAMANSICSESFGSVGPGIGKHWFSVLISEGIFRRDHSLPDEEGQSQDPFASIETVFRFSYQRFSDHLVVRSLLVEVTDIKAAFANSGCLSYLLQDRSWRWSSLWQALAVQVPEKYEIEIFDAIDSADSEAGNFLIDAFHQSLLWRSPRAFTNRTLFYFNRYRHLGAAIRLILF